VIIGPACLTQRVMRNLLLILALIGVAGCIHGPHAFTGTGAEHDQTALPPSPEEIIRAASLTGITEPDFVAWTPGWTRVVLVGRSGTNYVAVVARADSKRVGRWHVALVPSRMAARADLKSWRLPMGEGISCEWNYDHRPRRDEIDKLIWLVFRDGEWQGFIFAPWMT